jgi:hypothetical protein
MRKTIELSKLHRDLTTVKDGLEAIQYLPGKGAFAGAPRPNLTCWISIC